MNNLVSLRTYRSAMVSPLMQCQSVGRLEALPADAADEVDTPIHGLSKEKDLLLIRKFVRRLKSSKT